ncbi:hypothetical protein [Azospirillum aestuarii]|uniref:hypothetical protein n=1 Tax=Azospirillum aestuarii TaxID=2802052 RepID=UPI0040551167
MPKSKKPTLDHETLELGPLPVDAINHTLGLELEPGDAVLLPIISRHVLKRHPEDHRRCLAHVGTVIQNPLFAGDDFNNPGKFELIARVPAVGAPLLVSIEMEKNEDGLYEVRSFYTMQEQKVQNRLRKGFLKPLQKR